ALFGATFIASAAALLGAESTFREATTRPDFVLQFFESMPFALVFAVPFTFGGLVLGALLSSPEYVTRRVYFYDLMGSAAGAVLILPVISGVGVEHAVVGVGLLQIVGTVVLFPP